jgi:hypothetical protein
MSQKKPMYAYQCPNCQMRVWLYVRPSTAPTCQNPKRHAHKLEVMNKIPNEGYVPTNH